jgi:uncharacterized protein
MNRPNIELILMSTLACNMACRYCYVGQKRAACLDLDLAKRAVEQVVAYNDETRPTNIFWHGAEPLLAGIDYYREICAWTRRRYGRDRVNHHIQTNGTLLDEAWFDLFIEEHITAGVSLDGPQLIHNANRAMQDGRGSFERVYHNIHLAREKRLYLDALVVITRDTLGHEDELFDFFYDNRIEFGFEPVVLERGCSDPSIAITPREYAGVAVRLFDRWLGQPEPRLRTIIPLQDFALGVMSGRNTRCAFSRSCGRHYLAVDPSGAVYPCVRFGGDAAFCLGDIRTQSLEEIINAPRRLAFLQPRVERIKRCADCQWRNLCNSGCPQHAYAATGAIDQPDPFCASYQLIFNHVSRRLESLLNGTTSMGSVRVQPAS